jgi:hypothetical protein
MRWAMSLEAVPTARSVTSATSWERHHIVVDFTALKYRLADVKAQFRAEASYHIGDPDMDRFLADRAGFRFVRADASVCQAWGPQVFPQSPEAGRRA